MEPIGPPTREDPLGEALHLLRMNGAFYGRSELSEPWGLTLPPLPGYLWFHVVSSGRCWLEAEGAGPRLLQRGDVALVPHGEGHALRSEPGAAAPGILDLEREVLSDRYEVIRHGGGGAATTLMCGAVRFDHPAARGLVEALPETIHIEASAASRVDSLQGVLALLGAEAKDMRAGGEAVLVTPRRYRRDPGHPLVGRDRPGGPGRMARRPARPPYRRCAVVDPSGPGAAVDGGLPGRRGGDVALGLRGALHRAGRRARHALRRPMADAGGAHRTGGGGATIAELARRLGYRSEAAFARAFKRVVGISPGAVKRTPKAGLRQSPEKGV